ncbi:MAG: TetR/AcrR family transcriptional regulator [Pseudomonadota bacterium]|nr:TetR/AcrR family transcriptional regulator [Pseudomonadota bacterium]
MKPGSDDAPRSGRPPSERACEVEPRILDAAARVFLERGFDGASIELIAETARAGKPTIYARYRDKAALFEAAFLRRLAARNERLETHRPQGDTVEARLTSIGVALALESLTEDFIGLMRLAIAQSRRMPEMGESLMGQTRERGGRLVARLLREEICAPGWTEARALKAGRIFAEVVLLPFLLRALSTRDLSGLRAEVEPHVADRVGFFLAGLRNGGLTAPQRAGRQSHSA